MVVLPVNRKKPEVRKEEGGHVAIKSWTRVLTVGGEREKQMWETLGRKKWQTLVADWMLGWGSFSAIQGKMPPPFSCWLWLNSRSVSVTKSQHDLSLEASVESNEVQTAEWEWEKICVTKWSCCKIWKEMSIYLKKKKKNCWEYSAPSLPVAEFLWRNLFLLTWLWFWLCVLEKRSKIMAQSSPRGLPLRSFGQPELQPCLRWDMLSC